MLPDVGQSAGMEDANKASRGNSLFRAAFPSNRCLPPALPHPRTPSQVVAFAPEVLVVAGMHAGSALRPLTDLCAVAALPGWWLLPAVRAGAVFVADDALFCRPGPRLVEGLECLARMLYEDAMTECCCPDRAVLKLSLRPGQRCRPRLLPNYFIPFT